MTDTRLRRNLTWGMSTASLMVMLFSYHTSTGGTGAAKAVAAEPVPTATVTVTATPTAPADASSSASGATDDAETSGTTGSSAATTPSSATSSKAAAPASTPSSTPTASASASASAQSTGTKTYTGDTVQTQWGPVQVQITVSDGKITKSIATQYPWNNGHDQQINSYALPILNAAVVSAQSAQIDSVGGATVTSEGYITSLQSALDQANIR